VATIPAFSHVVFVAMENHGFSQIIGSANAPYINNTLVPGGALFTNFHAPGHPSFPNYLYFFSGRTLVAFATGGDACPPAGSPYSVPNLYSAIIGAGRTFAGYMQSWPGSPTACGPSPYAGRHVFHPWFANVPASVSHDFTSFPQTAAGWAALPAVTFISPDLAHDMHSFGTLSDAQTIANGDTFLRSSIDGYAQWAKVNNSLLIVWWDEDFGTSDNPPLIFYGANIVAGRYSELLHHENVLRVICDIYGAAPPGAAATATQITDIWSTGPPPPPPALSLDTKTIPAATAGTFYTTTLAASGGTPPYAWPAPTGLPTGVTLNITSGVLSGTPLNGGSFPFTAKVTDQSSPVKSATQLLTLTVGTGPPPPPGQPSILTTSLPSGQVGTAYSTTLLGSGGTPPYAWSLVGSLPSGLALSGAVLSGIPGSAGSFNLTAHLLDFAGQSATPQPLTLTVGTGPPPPPPPSGSPFAAGAGVSTTMVPADVMGATLVNTLGFVAIQDVTP
jgi:hypothetical protein